ncbi:transcriptional regulator [Gordonia spumicola]|uniref:Transcriptional regulator n=2 Tax=Gordonia spumicola TaxID=589161 RepID=A0A7I9V5P1_9ACTN|nr:transcriptional regulator [Gordonia spumicola]
MQIDDLHSAVETMRRANTDLPRIEVKAGGGGVGKSLLPTISAFSNSPGGGVVILGLDEKAGFTPTPGFDAQAAMDALVEIVRPRKHTETPGPLTPRPSMVVDRLEFEGADLVVAEVAEIAAAAKPCFVTAQGKENGSYTRIGEGDHRLDTYEVFQMSTLTVPSSADRVPVSGARIDDLNKEAISRTLHRLRTNRPRVLDGVVSDREALERIGVVDRDTGIPTLAGLLALGRFPQQFFPQLMISFAAYPGADKTDVVGVDRMTDRAVLEGAIPDMVDDAVAVVIRNLRVRRVSAGVGAEDVPEIPVDAMREAIVNAVMHRDYSEMARGDQVRLELYPDRLEVHSPGVLWGGRGIEALYGGGSWSRNQTLARLLTDVPFADRDESVGENAGSGIRRMYGEMTRSGLPAPRFVTTTSSFTTTLDRFGLLTPDVHRWLDGLGGRDRTAIEDIALAVIHHLGSVTVDELRRQVAVDSSDARTALDDLTRDGLLVHDLGEYRMSPETATADLTAAERRVVDVLSSGDTLTIREIAAATQTTVSSLRPVLRNLVGDGRIHATAPPTSRNRAYRLANG